MKFLLIASQRKDKVKAWVCQETTPVGSILPPMDLAYVASVIRQKGHEAKILDLRFYNEHFSVLQKEVEAYKPEYVVINLTTTSAKQDYELMRQLPKFVKKICFGTHAMSLPKDCFDHCVDFILTGDPEGGMTNLLDNNLDGDKSDGVLTKTNMQKQPVRMQHLDNLPFAAYDLLDFDKYHAPYMKGKFSLMLTSRGCPFLCTFCLYPVLFGKDYRLRSPKNIVDELKVANEQHGITDFLFLDATFNSTEQKVVNLCDEIIARNLKVRWMCNMRAPGVKEEMLLKMKRAGCVRIFYGVEDPDFLKEIKKGMTWKQTVEAFNVTKKVGINTVAFMMLFDRDDVTENEYVDKVLHRLNELNADAFQCNVSVPFPGTEFYEQHRAAGGLMSDWDLFDPGGLQLPYATKLDLVKIKRKVYVRFALSNPRIILKTVAQMNMNSLLAISQKFVSYAFGGRQATVVGEN